MGKNNLFVRVNGRGNAWPVFLGGESNFYNSASSEDLSNASFSILKSETKTYSKDAVAWEILIDAGHHTVPFLIKNGNRIPNALVLTHGHMDHTLGIDWIAQSKYYLSGKSEKFPLYCTKEVWNFVRQSYPHLQKIIDYNELKYAEKKPIVEVNNLFVTAFPVYHGPHAAGASMLFFEYEGNKVLFTGDMLCPILRRTDYEIIKDAEAVYIDSNNRFPYPLSNHGSIINVNSNDIDYIDKWSSEISLNDLLKPHLRDSENKVNIKYLQDFESQIKSIKELPLSIFEFATRLNSNHINLIHYGGVEDRIYYGEEQLSQDDLKNWVCKKAEEMDLSHKMFYVPQTGDIFALK